MGPDDDWVAVATLDAVLSIAATLIRSSGKSAPVDVAELSRVRGNVAALIAQLADSQMEVNALRGTVDRLVARVDRLEDRP